MEVQEQLKDSSEMEVLEKLKDVGDKLLRPPSALGELLSLLDRLEYNLIKVDQSPSELMKEALLPILKALIGNGLLRHPYADVKVSVASCITEITRITAPDAPYNDEQMKEIFRLTVAAFGKLSHPSSHGYLKAVSILDTVAKVKSCLVMLDLDCALVVEMFKHFLIAIGSNHRYNVFTDMEAIMTMVLEESDDISWELLSPLLDSVRKENQKFSPMSWKLGAKVIKNCAAKLKPYLIEAVRSRGIVLRDYTQVVASICENAFHTAVHSHVNGSGEHLADEKKSERTAADVQSQVVIGLAHKSVCRGVVGPVVDGSKSILSIVTDETMNDDTMKAVKSKNEPGTLQKKRCQRLNSLLSTEKQHDHCMITRGKKTPELSSHIKYHDKAFEAPHIVNGFGEQLVGSRIKVWWPKDKMFYEGVVDSFDCSKKKHKVLYDDGDVEILNLKTQRWELFRDELLPDEGKQADHLPSHDASSEMWKKEEKVELVPSSKHERSIISHPSACQSQIRRPRIHVSLRTN